MSEKYRREEKISKKQGLLEREEGIAEYLASPRSKEGVHPELADSFEDFYAEKPLRKEDVEKDVELFVKENLEKLLPSILGLSSLSEDITNLEITNEQLALSGDGYIIGGEEGKAQIGTMHNSPPYFIESEFVKSDLLALAFAKNNLRLDSRRDSGKKEGDIPHRYFLQSQGRYLCTNDFGVKYFDEEAGEMMFGDPMYAGEYVVAVQNQMRRISENFSRIASNYIEKYRQEITQRTLEESGTGQLDWEGRKAIDKQVGKMVTKEIVENFARNPKDLDLVVTAASQQKVLRHYHYHQERIAKKYGLLSGDAVKDYDDFESNKSNLNRLIRQPSEAEKAGTTLDFVYSDFFDKPVIVSKDSSWDEEDGFNQTGLLKSVAEEIKEYLAKRAISSDPATEEIFDSHPSRNQNSPYAFATASLFEFVRAVGPEKADKILGMDNRRTYEQMKGWGYLQAMGFNMSTNEPDKIKKQLHESFKLSESGVWKYLEERSAPLIKKETTEASDKEEHWLKSIGKRKAQNLFWEGKKMYWLAQQVWKAQPDRSEEDRFYRDYHRIDWQKFDVSKVDISEEKLSEHLQKNINLACALLGDIKKQYSDETAPISNPATLGTIVKALDEGVEIRGIALAWDKQRYLEGAIGGAVKDDIMFAIADWPEEYLSAVSDDEMRMYYEYADDYIKLDRDGLAKYAVWRASEDGKKYDEVFKEKPKGKSDLDFRICLGAQTEEVRGWYRESAEYLGGNTVQDYLLRFNATRGPEGRLANWHDTLFWVPNLQKLEITDARTIIANINTMDDNQEFIQFLPRYDKGRDMLKQQGTIQSLRELKKRVFAIESNINLTELPPQIFDIITAPGFNLSALDTMHQRVDFHNLIEGKLDEKQPFQPHRRLFAGRPLTEALSEGLGSFKKKIKGTAADSKGLFFSLDKLIGDRKIGERKMTVADLLKEVPLDLEEDIIKLLQDQKVNIGPSVEAQIHAKSDPEGWVCGNYTDCCMPFGDQKNNDYMFNKGTQYFTVKFNGRIIAQSVVVDSRDNETGEDVVILDNIEIANNYKNLSPLIANAYRTFWTEYTSRPVKVGTGYADLVPPGGNLESNKYEPKNSLGYSDARGNQIYDFPKIRGVEAMDRVVTIANLTERDAELIAKMEAEAYPEGMAQGKTHIADVLQKQREMDVPGAASSFVIRQGEEPAGYLLMLPGESEVNSGEKVAHVYDMVVLKKFRGTSLARKMMERVLDVASSYGVAIEAEARASTSYALLMNERTRRWFESKGFRLTTNEKLPEYLGGEDFYFIRFENQQNIENP